MSDISRGRLEHCKDSVGGIKNIYIVAQDVADYELTELDLGSGDTGLVRESRDEVISVWQFTPSRDSSYTENISVSKNNGTAYFESVLDLTFPKLTFFDHFTIKKITHGFPKILVEDNNNNVVCVSFKRGMSVTSGSIESGASMGDMSGYKLTITGEDKEPAPFLVERGRFYDASYINPDTGLVTPSIIEGNWRRTVIDILNT